MIDITSGDCPNSNLLKPCTCVEGYRYVGYITCEGKEDIDLVKIFQTLGKNLWEPGKHFKSINLKNQFITELKENTFSDITFDEINIYGCSKLKKIHINAFNTTDQVTTLR